MNELVFWPILVALGAITVVAVLKAVEAMHASKLADDECTRLRAQLHSLNDHGNGSAIDTQLDGTPAVNQGGDHHKSANDPSDIFHCILAHVTKYHSQNDAATPKRIAADLLLDPEVTLAYMWKYHNEQFITFNSINSGGRPDVNTPFFLSPSAWQHIKVVPA